MTFQNKDWAELFFSAQNNNLGQFRAVYSFHHNPCCRIFYFSEDFLWLLFHAEF